jgi:hypothetical protein
VFFKGESSAEERQVKERDLNDVKVGDFIGPVHSRMNKWTGVLHEVQKVGAKRFMACGRWYDKATGREPGRGGGDYTYILATPEMIAAHRAKQTAREEEEAKLKAFHARPDYQDASTIAYTLSRMNPDNHPLDRLTPEEWAQLRRRLQV